MLNYLERFKNTGTIMSLTGLLGMLAIQFGVKVDMEWLNNTIQIICSILVLLGICNNPHTNGLDLPTKEKVEG
ncbi:hypothetical protein JW813_07720 [Clostridium botulinum]|uniref:hypothetical protein n=1 Tax=Clostridium TaxID=1485 RepID=UPI0013C78A9F|nr:MULTISPECIES: hypothetical protein [Clostridium]NFH99457.1 hypothetical protein [Clostridium botulinum]NFI62208.1 hypothetical protein [Clostridium botulinum]NFJ42586.1 hypothetical protein [Clostridium botulinum]NFJ46543.1 hypothetical protein [Clostridium botulinum]NFK26415.1 hypothetical protein [Clostridium botulinum]